MAVERYVQVGELTIRYKMAGDSGSPVVLLHGLGGFAELWDKNIDALATRHRVFALDLPGFGRSDKPRHLSYSIPYFAEFLREWLGVMGLPKVSLIGNSMGGGVATMYAYRFPELVDKLVSVAGVGFGTQVSKYLRLASVHWLGELVTRPGKQVNLNAFKTTVFSLSAIPLQYAELWYEMMALPGAQQAYLIALRSLANWQGLNPQMIAAMTSGATKITAPTLVIWGDHDQVLPATQAHTTAATIPHARLEIFEQCGHLPQAEHPEKFNALVLKLLRMTRKPISNSTCFGLSG